MLKPSQGLVGRPYIKSIIIWRVSIIANEMSKQKGDEGASLMKDLHHIIKGRISFGGITI